MQIPRRSTRARLMIKSRWRRSKKIAIGFPSPYQYPHHKIAEDKPRAVAPDEATRGHNISFEGRGVCDRLKDDHHSGSQTNFGHVYRSYHNHVQRIRRPIQFLRQLLAKHRLMGTPDIPNFEFNHLAHLSSPIALEWVMR